VNKLLNNQFEVVSKDFGCDPMQCLNAIQSNLKSLYGDSYSGDQFDKLVKKIPEQYRQHSTVPPTQGGRTLTSHDDFEASDVTTNIPQTLLGLVNDEDISIFAVGVAAGYHTMIVIVLQGNHTIWNPDGEKLATTSQGDPKFILLDPRTCAECAFQTFSDRYGTLEYLDRLLLDWYIGASNHYRDNIEGPANMDASVYQLFKR
jgi:hypothetical protein